MSIVPSPGPDAFARSKPSLFEESWMQKGKEQKEHHRLVINLSFHSMEPLWDLVVLLVLKQDFWYHSTD